jgi:hypothetical protein
MSKQCAEELDLPNPHPKSCRLEFLISVVIVFVWKILLTSLFMLIGGIKYTKSAIRNQSIIQIFFFFIIEFKMVIDEQQTGFQNGGFLKPSQLHKCGFAYI